jgi:hypothetical protein
MAGGLILDGPRRRVHPGSGGRPPTGPELAPRLGPRMAAGALADTRRAPRATSSSAAGREARASRTTGSNRRHAVTARKRARRGDQAPLARCWRPAIETGSRRPRSLVLLPFLPGASLPRARALGSGGLPVESGASVAVPRCDRPRPRSSTARVPEGTPRMSRASISEKSSRSPPGNDPASETVRRCHRIAPMASIVGLQGAVRPIRGLAGAFPAARRSMLVGENLHRATRRSTSRPSSDDESGSPSPRVQGLDVPLLPWALFPFEARLPPAAQALAGAWAIPPPVHGPTAERATGVVARTAFTTRRS